MKALKTGLFTFLFLFSAAAFAQDFAMYDTNDDGMWDENEFNESFTEDNFDTWDSDVNGFIEDDEFYDSTFGVMDDNNNFGIDENEWNNGVNDMFADYADTDDFGTFDTDNDGIVDNDEWNVGFGDSNWFNDYDKDKSGSVDNEELNDGVFDDWDNNNDSLLDENEYADNSGFFETW